MTRSASNGASRSALRYWRLAIYKGWMEIQSDRERGYLGMAWWFLEPLLFMGAFYLVFSTGFRSGGLEFVYFLLCGLVPWRWFGASVQAATNLMSANRAVIHQVYFPKWMLLISLMTANSTRFLLVFAVLLILIGVSRGTADASWLYLVPVTFAQFLLLSGVCGLASIAVVYIPDLRFIISNAMLLVFFMSGVFYDTANRAPDYQWVFEWNPVAQILTGYRSVLLENSPPDLTGGIAYASVLGAILLLLSTALIIRADRTIPKVIL